MKSGRTIGERREKIETASERASIHKKIKLKKNFRIIVTCVGFILVIAFVAWIFSIFSHGEKTIHIVSEVTPAQYSPTIEIIDEDASITGGHISSRMKEYIGLVEADLRELGITPTKAVVPTGAIREVDFYLEGYTGFIKMTIDRGSGVSAEDTDRMLRYLSSMGVTDFQYIDVRIDGKAYWKQQ